jgi:competence/damage-inducible protein CinA-like protein
MPAAEVITIGTELLLGEITDTNAVFLARRLRNLGIDLYRKVTIGDNASRIAQAVRESLSRAEIILTTGGLGPTIDDPTRLGIAQALEVEMEFHPELWQQIQDRFARFRRLPTENNKRQAYLPKGALPIENPVGTAPAFLVEKNDQVIIALPGVPGEMEYLFEHYVRDYLRQKFDLRSIIKTRILHTAGVGESLIDERIGDLETMKNPTVGLAAHSGQVDVRITAKAASEREADHLIAKVEHDLRLRLGEWIYGADQETLEKIARERLTEHGWSLAAVEAGMGGEVIRRLAALRGAFVSGEVLSSPLNTHELKERTEAYRHACGSEVGVGVSAEFSSDRAQIHLVLLTPGGTHEQTFHFGGPLEYAHRWAGHNILNLIRKIGG